MSSESRVVAGSTDIPTDRPVFADPEQIFADSQQILGRKWHLRIVHQLLANGPLGFSELKTQVTGVSSKMLSESLSSLEDHGIVDRSVVSEQPVRVEYTLTERGQELETVISAVLRWGDEYGPTEGK